ncbi:MAG: helix-turn-helix domain-containing protein [Methanomicrobiaceae archaeon]|nr:helix-turn-helix domain-containing protein [Methanomicrobiaceae archaeon]
MQMKAYRYRLYPTTSQVSQMERTLEICRWVYSETLALRKDRNTSLLRIETSDPSLEERAS